MLAGSELDVKLEGPHGTVQSHLQTKHNLNNKRKLDLVGFIYLFWCQSNDKDSIIKTKNGTTCRNLNLNTEVIFYWMVDGGWWTNGVGYLSRCFQMFNGASFQPLRSADAICHACLENSM